MKGMTTFVSASARSFASGATDGSLLASTTACAEQHQDAAVTEVPNYDEPAISQAENVSGTSLVKISLNPTGRLSAASLWTSSGNPLLDAAALKGARSSKYASEVNDCERVSGLLPHRREL
jgi:TonB family protein